MDIEEIRRYCLAKKSARESFPFGPDTLVFKVDGRIFLLLSLDEVPMQFNVKCDPEKAIALREKYPAVQPGYHMNKKHWNTIVCDGSVPRREVLDFIDDSYNLVAKQP